MAGGDVEGLLEKAEDQRLPVERTLAVAKDVCRGLAFIHSTASSTATSSPATSGSPRTAPPRLATSAWPWRSTAPGSLSRH